ncbi:endonuclease/exonuclease/phosphatase family protein-like protein [Macrophomina phaseolina]|uniref:Endonuclease/exonuclease/phosphatase family protein-like protein n=1 Tax=Macrophomina phaseolina TaxID=35725 RepID=A0ABQ8FTH6_9PEZI|nr:endonuclease/exonuclease/phosphatase family protein-like protein [Macrophomina phaseolina]
MWTAKSFSWNAAALLCLRAAAAVTISEINGGAFVSPLRGQSVTNVTGIVTAKGPSGFWIRSPSPSDNPGSDSIYVFSSSAGANLTVGDRIALDATVTEYRSSSAYLFLTELSSPRNVAVISTGNVVEPILIGSGSGLAPPTEQFSGLDGGDVFAVPNNQSLVSITNPKLQPDQFGLDFWESLVGELVTIEMPVALGTPNSFDEVWVRGNWTVTGLNERGGVTMTDADANPEAIIIGDPLDGTTNPSTVKLGDSLSDITGVLRFPRPSPATTLTSTGTCSGLTFGSYNVENLAPNSTHLPLVAEHIVTYLHSPDLLFLQEVQDDSGPTTGDGIVSSATTLSTLTSAIAAAGGPAYNFSVIDPVDLQDGGQPGGNIRVAYLYNPLALALLDPSPGDATTPATVVNVTSLTPNPGRLDPSNAAWSNSRKPLAALWQTADGEGRLWTVNVHWTSKGGSSSLHGDARPPVNGGVDSRIAQATATAEFLQSVFAADAEARVIVAGDFNEFAFVEPLRVLAEEGKLVDADEAAGVAEVERYTYLFDMNAQQLDHVFVSGAVSGGGVEYEHVHVNTWVSAAEQVSDHDPSVGRVDVCV